MLHYVNAGHNPPLLVRRDGAITLLDDAGFPVGMFPDSTYAEVMVQLRPGDLVVAYTDGVTEASDADGEELGLERVARVAAESLEQHPDRVAKSIFDTMDEFSVGQQRDDATVLVFRVD
jgi:phosphoserine phosphatase RsbU/P